MFDLGHQVYRITATSVDHVDNGTDAVLFLHNAAWTPFSLGTPRPEGSLWDEIVLSPIPFRAGALTLNDYRRLFRLWFYVLFFPELFPTRPIAALVGEKGSTKSFVLRKVGRLLFGPSFNVMSLSKDSKDFDAAITHDHFVAVDNADTPVRWLNDRLAVAATGGTLKRRAYYTTNRLVEYPIRAYLGITSRTPHFHRDDVADRLLLFQVNRLEDFVSERALLAEVDEHRDDILTEVVSQLQRIVQAVQDRGNRPYRTPFRMADFADFALTIANAEGWGDEMVQILDRLAAEQARFAVENEPIVELLDLWLARADGRNDGREVTTADLAEELTSLAALYSITFRFGESGQSLAQHLRQVMDTLRVRYEITEREGGGHTRFLAFRFKPTEASAAAENPGDQGE